MIKETFIQEKRPHESGAKACELVMLIIQMIFLNLKVPYIGAIGYAKKSRAIIKKIDLKKSSRK